MPFLDENDDDYYSPEPGKNVGERYRSLLSGDRWFYIIGGAASVVAFVSIMTVMYVNSKPVDLGELPVIQADTNPIKIKPEHNEQVAHQDKIVYDNISGDSRVLQERVAPKPEEPVQDLQSLQEDVLSEEERNNIIREFDELAPRTSAAYIPPRPSRPKVQQQEEKTTPPIRPGVRKNNLKQVVSQNLKPNPKQKKSSAADISPRQGTVMIQVASVGSKTAAEAEYNRVVRKNGFLRRLGKKIVKVDLGAKGIKYRVQIGPFKNRSEAQNYISQLRNAGTMSYISK